MKKNIPKWLVGDVYFTNNNYISVKTQKVTEEIFNKIKNSKMDEFEKYFLVQSYFNKYFYDLKLMNEEIFSDV